MPDSDNNAMIRQWLKDKGYSDRDVNKVLAKLAEHDHQTLSDAVFDSIGGDGKSLEDMIGDLLKEG
jgi:hypothetical protein